MQGSFHKTELGSGHSKIWSAQISKAHTHSQILNLMKRPL